MPRGLPLLLLLVACQAPEEPPTADAGVTPDGGAPANLQLRIVAPDGGVAGDALVLTVVSVLLDGTTAALPGGTAIAWSTPATIVAFPPLSNRQVPIWAFGADPTAYFVNNPGRPDRQGDLSGVLVLLDPGTDGGELEVQAIVGDAGTASTSVTIAPALVGDASRGSLLYAANCARCHGLDAGGTPPAPDGGFSMLGRSYPYPAPPLNARPGHVGLDRSWSPPVLAWTARTDVDNEGVTLRAPMPDWLTDPGANGQLLTTQDFADIYSYLTTLH